MPRGQSYPDRRRNLEDYFLSEFPIFTVDQMARREGVSVHTVRKVSAELNIDIRKYNRRLKLVQKQNDLYTQIRALRQKIHEPIIKKEQ